MKPFKQLGCLGSCALILALSSCDKKDTPAESPLPETKTWSKLLGGNMVDYGRAVVKLGDGGYLLGSETNSNNNGDIPASKGNLDVMLVKVDADGMVIWKKNYGGEGNDQMTSMVANPDGTVTIAGFTASNKSGDIPENAVDGQDIWVFKVDGNGNVVWTKTYNGIESDYVHSIVRAPDGGYLLTGYTTRVGSLDNLEMLILKIDMNGTESWKKIFAEDNKEAALGAVANADGTFTVAGWSNSASFNGEANSDYNAILMKLRSDGNVTWTKSFGGDALDYVNSIVPGADGGYVMAGGTMSNNSGDVGPNKGEEDCWVIKTDGNGILKWQKTFGGAQADVVNSITRTDDDGFLIAGSTFSSGTGDISAGKGGNDGLLIRLNANGEVLKHKLMGGDETDFLKSVITASDGGFIAIGETESNNSHDIGANKGLSDIWVIKFKDI